LFTLEEHSITGGLGSAVAELLAENSSSPVLFRRLGLPPVFSSHIGTQEYMQRQHGLDPESIVESVLKLLSTSEAWHTQFATAH
jgi:transketolase